MLAIIPVELGELDGIPLSFTDAAALSNGDIIFSAALERVSENVKLEAVAVIENGDTADLLLVSDADDADVAASLYAASIKTSRRPE